LVASNKWVIKPVFEQFSILPVLVDQYIIDT
jgi:hypothetical protein